ncbi:MAG TPA: hypothetical protein PLM07_05390 [Candidatus Rifleibacterium sp.]|nr:hypothetical protein [Candidatus Rifleibacterium sp.]HPT45315.1 hypothetical protein [Candidatus Rifleibacterium sp.]
MKRVIMVALLAAMLVVFFSGFMAADHQPLYVVECRLASGDANLKILPGPMYRYDSVSLHVKVTGLVQSSFAEGFRRIELLNIPADGLVFRVPLSEKLVEGQIYRVSVIMSSPDAEASQSEWHSITAQGTCSDDFFARRFKAITEPATMRNQVSARAIRKIIL